MSSVNEITKRNVQRSAAYPGTDIEEAISNLKKLKDNLGKGPYDRESASKAMGYMKGVNGASASKIAALVHFGLLSRIGNTYNQSSLAEAILFNTTSEEEKKAIVESAQTPKLYKSLIDKFKDAALPSLLSNILIRDYGISENASKKAGDDFKKTMEFAGLLRNGVLKGSIEENKVTEKVEENTITPSEVLNPNSLNETRERILDNEMQIVELSLSEGKARLIVPKVLTENDAKKLKAQVNILANIFD